MENGTIKIFESDTQLVEGLVDDMIEYFENQLKIVPFVSVALSGGNTPKKIYKYISEKYGDLTIWENIKFFWGDERCVPPEDPESNFGAAKELFFDKIKKTGLQIFRMRGEENPANEAERYASLLLNEIENENGLPRFDLVILGIGEDGHTASIFPNQMDLLSSQKICEVSTNPENGQKRITLTGTVINMSKRVTFMATGESKQDVLRAIHNNEPAARKFPAAKIAPQNGLIDWYLDSDAADQI